MTELLIVLKAALILVLGLTATALARSCRASRRHVILAAAFGGLLILPLTVLVLPAVKLQVPAGRLTQPVSTAPVTSPQSSSGIIANPSALVSNADQKRSVAFFLRTIWGAVSVILLFSMAATHYRLRRIRRNALPWTASPVATLAKDAGICRPIEVLLHSEIAAPMTLGFLRPAVLLPLRATEWPEPEIHRALVHELAHIRRADWPIHIAARLACVLYWFLPMSWIAWRRLCLEAERSCDDAVLQKADCAEYADQLVQLARHLSDGAPSALAMASRSDLSARVRAILDGSTRRGPVGSMPALLCAAIALVVVVGIAPVVPALVAGGGAQAAEWRVRAMDRALMEAADSGNLQDMVDLLNAGANVNCAVYGDGSPLIIVARRGWLPAVQLLLERGADVNQSVKGDGNPLLAAAARGNLEIVDLLLKRGARIEDVVPGDENALIQASGSGRLNVVKLLVSRGANVNARVWAEGGLRDGEWRTPLSMALRGRHLDVVTFLKSAGATQ